MATPLREGVVSGLNHFNRMMCSTSALSAVEASEKQLDFFFIDGKINIFGLKRQSMKLTMKKKTQQFFYVALKCGNMLSF